MFKNEEQSEWSDVEWREHLLISAGMVLLIVALSAIAAAYGWQF